MGSWGRGPFEDDTAMDFIDDLADGPATQVVPALLGALDHLVSQGAAQDYGLSVRGLAAAALLAGFVPYPGDAKRLQWVASTIPPLNAEVAMLACQAIDAAYGDDGILAEFAIEAGNLAEYRVAIEPVRQRLRAAVPPPQVEVLF